MVKIYRISVLMFAILLTGCRSEAMSQSDLSSAVETQNTISNIQLNTDIHAVTVPETLSSYIMSLPIYGEDIEHLFVGEEVQSTPMDWEFAHADFGKEYSDGSQLMYFSGDFMWQKDPENDNGLYGVAVTGIKKHAESETLSLNFAKREDVEKQITNIVEQMTSFKIDEVRCFGLTQDMIKEAMEEHIRQYGAVEDYSSFGGMYLVEVGFSLDDVPVYSGIREKQKLEYYQGQDTMQAGSMTAVAVVTADGLRYFDFMRPYQIEKEKENSASISVEEALKKAGEILKEQQEKIVIDTITFEYTCVYDTEAPETACLQPYWVFEGQNEKEQKSIRINAFTGEAIYDETDNILKAGMERSDVTPEVQIAGDHMDQCVENNLEVHADVKKPEKESGSIYKVEFPKYAYEMENLFVDENIGRTRSTEGYCPEEGEFHTELADGGSLGYVEGRFRYLKNTEIDDALYSVTKMWLDDHQEEGAATELTFMTKKQAEQKALALLGRFTEQKTEVLRTASFEKQELKEIHMQYIAGDNITDGDETLFDAIDGVYVVRMQLKVDGIQVYSGMEEAEVEDALETPVAWAVKATVLIDKDGVRCFWLEYPPKITETGKEQSYLSVEEALQIATSNLQNLILNQKITISDIYFEYVHVNATDDIYHGELRPYWVFVCTYENGQKTAIRINALTGGDLKNGM